MVVSDFFLTMAENLERSKNGIHAIAAFEAVKGTAAVAVACGLLSLVHRDLAVFAGELVETLHLNTEGRLAHELVESLSGIDPSDIRIFFVVSLLYAALRFVEAYGLWRLRAWAKWLAIVSGAVYLPIEIYEIFAVPTVFRVLVLLVNLGIVLYLFSVRPGREREKLDSAERESSV